MRSVERSSAGTRCFREGGFHTGGVCRASSANACSKPASWWRRCAAPGFTPDSDSAATRRSSASRNTMSIMFCSDSSVYYFLVQEDNALDPLPAEAEAPSWDSYLSGAGAGFARACSNIGWSIQRRPRCLQEIEQGAAGQFGHPLSKVIMDDSCRCRIGVPTLAGYG